MCVLMCSGYLTSQGFLLKEGAVLWLHSQSRLICLSCAIIVAVASSAQRRIVAVASFEQF